MSISHWGIFPGWMVLENALAVSSRCVWQVQKFDSWCSVYYGDWQQGPFVHEGMGAPLTEK